MKKEGWLVWWRMLITAWIVIVYCGIKAGGEIRKDEMKQYQIDTYRGDSAIVYNGSRIVDTCLLDSIGVIIELDNQ